MSGHFDDLRKEYVIEDMFPRRELYNYLWNSDTVCVCNQFGGGSAWSLIGNTRRQLDSGQRLVYIKDRDSGRYFAATRNFSKEKFDLFNCHVGLGYQKIVSEYCGVRTEMTVVVPSRGRVLLHRISIQNISDKSKNLDVYFYNRPCPALTDHDAYGEAVKAENFNGIIYAHDGYDIEMPYKYLYLAADKEFYSYEVSDSRFVGTYDAISSPIALQSEKLSGKGVNFESSYVGALQFRIDLNAGEKREICIVCGMARSESECSAYAKEFASLKRFDKELAYQEETNGRYTDVFKITSPDSVLDSQTNIWLKRQLSLGKDWGRLYGKGFRDVMQDIAAFVSLDASFARERILDVMKWQYEDGNPIRMFEPSYYYPYNDGGVWIPTTILTYLNESGDFGILDEKISWLKGTSAENSSYDKPIEYAEYSGTEEKSSLFEHIKRAMDYLYGCRGKRGLVLFLGGDWNDSLNSVGKLGKGEGVWLTISAIKAYNEFIEILNLCGKTELAEKYELRRAEMKEAVMKYGWDGDHLIYGFNDYDEKIGSDENEEAKIFLNPQTWAVLANLTDKKILEKLIDGVENRLSCDYGYLQCYPSYTKGNDKIGRISYFKAGLVENGAVYNHGVAFKIVADCMLGRGDKAYESLKKIRFDNIENKNNGMEPYAVSNMYMGPENPYIAGYAPMSWITGTAGWLYRCISEYICGIKAQTDGLQIKPCLPNAWNNLRVSRIFRGTVYNINFIRSNENKIVADGKVLSGNIIRNPECKKSIDVTVYYN